MPPWQSQEYIRDIVRALNLYADLFSLKFLGTERPNGKQLTHFHEFQTSLGAGEHCAIGAESHQNQVTLEWLSGIWGGLAFENNPIGI